MAPRHDSVNVGDTRRRDVRLRAHPKEAVSHERCDKTLSERSKIMTGLRAMTAHVCTGLVVLLAAGTALAQDSVSNNDTCSLGDAVAPWDTAEQVNNYVVDMTPFTTSWGTTFGIAPIAKSSKTSSDFDSSLTSASSISRLHIPVALSGTYDFWTTPGPGVNGIENSAPGGSVNLTGQDGYQFGYVLSEFSTTTNGDDYSGVLGGLVEYDATDPSRLYVKRVVAASNSCDGMNNLAASGVGSVDASGNLHFRVDGHGTTDTGATCSTALTNVPDDGYTRIYRVNVADRNPAALNVISDDYPGGLFDAGATDLVIDDYDIANATAVSLSTPNILPAEVRGGTPLYIGAAFDMSYVREVVPGVVTADTSHFTTNMTDQRGTLGYSTATCNNLLGDTHGIGSVIGHDGNGAATIIDVFGLDVSGSVTGKLELNLPVSGITDPTNGETDFGSNEFNHYHSQTAFRGGNSQVAVGNDADGNLLVAAEVDSPSGAGNNSPVGNISVARVNCQTGNVEWTLAGYSLGPHTSQGKPILDGPGGSVVGYMTLLSNVTGGAPLGPSFSAPMIDSAGNVWFISAVDLAPFNGPPYTSALLRAVYNPATFSYELELVAGLGWVFHGQNSGLDYKVIFWAIADADSVDSGTAWSSNMSQTAHLNGDPSLCQTSDAQTMGGMVIAASVLYDKDQDGEFVDCGELNSQSVPSTDQQYNVLLYFGSVSNHPCTPVVTPGPLLADNGPKGSRYFKFSAPAPATAGVPQEVVRVRITSLDGFPTPTPDTLYVGEPYDAPEENSSSPGLTFRTANLSCEPVFHDWSAEGTVAVYAAEIVPLSSYEIQRADSSCPDLSDESCWSTAVTVTTGKYADMVFPFEGSGSTQPDFSDISADVSKFLAAPDAPVKALAQLHPNVVFPMRPIDFQDIAAAVTSFLGTSYSSEYTGPCTCPSTVTCGATACASDGVCAPGYCIDGFCADACGRCAP